jgi:hypothetical protein
MSNAANRGAGFPQGRAEDTSTAGTASRLAGTVKDKAQDLASGAADLASQVRDKAQDMASRVGDTAHETWESTRQGAQHFAQNFASQAGDAFDDMTGLVRRYPIASLFCAFGLGFVLAKGLQAMTSNRSTS